MWPLQCGKYSFQLMESPFEENFPCAGGERERERRSVQYIHSIEVDATTFGSHSRTQRPYIFHFRNIFCIMFRVPFGPLCWTPPSCVHNINLRQGVIYPQRIHASILDSSFIAICYVCCCACRPAGQPVFGYMLYSIHSLNVGLVSVNCFVNWWNPVESTFYLGILTRKIHSISFGSILWHSSFFLIFFLKKAYFISLLFQLECKKKRVLNDIQFIAGALSPKLYLTFGTKRVLKDGRALHSSNNCQMSNRMDFPSQNPLHFM